VELLPDLQAYEKNHPPGTPIFNEMLYGGFLIYYTPHLRIFIDDRCELYGDEGLLALHTRFWRRPKSWSAGKNKTAFRRRSR
jgi:hypothetical protein